MDAARRSGGDGVQAQVQLLERRVDILEARLEHVMKKLALEEGTKTIHTRLLEQLGDWKSTSQLATELGYTQEYISRCVATLKRTAKVEERKSGKTIFYRKVSPVV